MGGGGGGRRRGVSGTLRGKRRENESGEGMWGGVGGHSLFSAREGYSLFTKREGERGWG